MRRCKSFHLATAERPLSRNNPECACDGSVDLVGPVRSALKATEFDIRNHPTLQVVENTKQKCVAGHWGFEPLSGTPCREYQRPTQLRKASSTAKERPTPSK